MGVIGIKSTQIKQFMLNQVILIIINYNKDVTVKNIMNLEKTKSLYNKNLYNRCQTSNYCKNFQRNYLKPKDCTKTSISFKE